MTEPIRLREGSRLGRYQVVRRLGAGAMGEVFLADDPQIGRRLAIKTVRVEEGRAQEVEERKRRLLREARAAGKLLHPNIVTLFDAGEDQGVLYLAFEFVEGTDVAERIAAGPALSLAEALSIVRQAAEALDYAHGQGVIHRDIKPSNLMLTASGRIKVADFGIAKVLDQTSDLTMTGSVVGSPHYLSPEQIRGDELDGRTDVFSLGVLFYEILCNRRPFEADTLTTLVYRILNQDPTPIVVRRPDLGPRLERLVQKMLAKERDARCASAAEVAAEIVACERDLPSSLLAGRARPEEEVTGATTLLPTTGGIAAPAADPAQSPTAHLPQPPPAPPAPVAPAPPAFVPPPPPPPPAALAPVAAAPLGRPSTDSTAFSPPSPPRSRLGLVALVAVGVIALLVVAGLGARRWAAGRDSGPETETATNTATNQPAAATDANASDARPLDQPAREPEPEASKEPIASAPPEPKSEPSLESKAKSEPQREPERTVQVAASEPAPTAPAFVPGERQPLPRPPEPPPARSTPPAPASEPAPTSRAASEPAAAPASAPAAAPAIAPAVPAVEDAPAPPVETPDPGRSREELIARIPVQSEMTTGMSLSFEVSPKDAAENVVVRFDRIVIGRAAEWNAKKRGGRAYSIAEPGLHILTFLVEGSEVYRIRIDAQPRGTGTSTITLNLPGAGRRGRRNGNG